MHHGGVPHPTVVLLHGQPDTSASFWGLRQALARRLPAGVRVAVPDRPGYGANPLHATDYAGNVTWLMRWLDKVDAGPAVVLGHSWAGGVAALAAADSRHGRIAGLVLMASVGPGCLVPIDPVLAAPVVGELLAYTMLGLGGAAVTRKAASVFQALLPVDEQPFAWASGAAMKARPMWRSFLVEQRALLADLPDITRALPRISVPTQIITGRQDHIIPDRTPQALAAAIPQSTLIRMDGAHDLQLRQPTESAERIAGFAAELLGHR